MHYFPGKSLKIASNILGSSLISPFPKWVPFNDPFKKYSWWKRSWDISKTLPNNKISTTFPSTVWTLGFLVAINKYQHPSLLSKLFQVQLLNPLILWLQRHLFSPARRARQRRLRPRPAAGHRAEGQGCGKTKTSTEFVDTEMGNHPPPPPQKNDIWRIDFTRKKMGLGMKMFQLWRHVWGNYWYLC